MSPPRHTRRERAASWWDELVPPSLQRMIYSAVLAAILAWLKVGQSETHQAQEKTQETVAAATNQQALLQAWVIEAVGQSWSNRISSFSLSNRVSLLQSDVTEIRTNVAAIRARVEARR